MLEGVGKYSGDRTDRVVKISKANIYEEDSGVGADSRLCLEEMRAITGKSKGSEA